jgi:hypothetical protein
MRKIARVVGKKNLRIATRRRLAGRSPARDDLRQILDEDSIEVKARNEHSKSVPRISRMR